MRLLEVNTFPPTPPDDKYTKRRYAILSHTWDANEITFQDLKKSTIFNNTSENPSWSKVRGSMSQARADGLAYIWIDTLCIDKSSSAELGEAINSMWHWYLKAELCYVYLSDVDSCFVSNGEVQVLDQSNRAQSFSASRWFRRGWTLQELLAPKPKNVRFFDKHWTYIGDLQDLALSVHKITRIHLDAFRGAGLISFSIAQRMSWAARRQTTKPEDRAYSLLGILGVSLDIRYGEGSRAFIRLQEEIISRSDDQSIFAWGKAISDEEWEQYLGDSMDYRDVYLLAPSPSAFSTSENIVPLRKFASKSYSLTNRGLQIITDVVADQFVVLECRYLDDPTIAIALGIRYPRKTSPSSQLLVPKQAPKNSRLISIEMVRANAAERNVDLTIRRGSKIPRWTGETSISVPAGPKLWLVMSSNYSYSKKSRRMELQTRKMIRFVESDPVLNHHTRSPTYQLPSEESVQCFVIRLSYDDRIPVEIQVLVAKSGYYLAVAVNGEGDMRSIRQRLEESFRKLREDDSDQFEKYLETEPERYLHLDAAVRLKVDLKYRVANDEEAHMLRVSMLPCPAPSESGRGEEN